MTLYVVAANIHQGGGAALLNALLAAIPNDLDTVVLADARMALPDVGARRLRYRTVAPMIVARVAANAWLSRTAREADRILCLGNLPPLFRPRGQVTLFLQNRLLIDPAMPVALSWRTRLRIAVERQWLRRRIRHVDRLIVQTASMRAAFAGSGIAPRLPIVVRPFVPAPAARPMAGAAGGAFVYVASGDAHKNHRRLIEAWELLAAEGIRPVLHLTVGRENGELADWIGERSKACGLQVVNHGQVPADAVPALYAGAEALVFPSLVESFGLPLLEAADASLAILAPELDYVRDLVDPAQTFDPRSPMSIARAVKRHLRLTPDRPPPIDARAFIEKLLAD